MTIYLPQDAVLLRIFFGEKDRHQGRPLRDAIVRSKNPHNAL